MSQLDTLTVPGLTVDEQITLNRLVAQLEAKKPRNLLRQRLYDNQEVARRIGDTIPLQYFRMGIVLGWTGKGVDSLGRRCTLERFVWADGDLSDIGAQDVWDDNNLRSEINSAKVSSLIHGPAFLVNTTGEGYEPKSLIHVRDALNATGDWNPRRRRMDNLLSVLGRDEQGGIVEFALYLDGLTITAKKDGSAWEVDHQDHAWGVPVEVMAYKPRVGRPMGSSRITRPLIGLQKQAVRALIRTEGHMDVFSYPDFWLLGALAKDIKGEDGANIAAMSAALGRIRGVPDLPADDPNARDNNLDRADIKQFPASAPTPNLAWLNTLAKLFARESSLPDSALAITDFANPTSADSYDASQYELIAEADGAVEDWSPAVKRSHLRALAILNGETEIPSEWKTIEPKWRDRRYVSPSAQADAGSKVVPLIAAATSEVELELLGLDEQQIRRIMAEKRRGQGSGVLDRLRDVGAPAAEDPVAVKAKADAMGVLIRSGVDPVEAAERVGFAGIGFTGAVPVSLRLPESDATKLEDKGASGSQPAG
ncbi:phage portal protein [Nocardioides alcanivorans]|uniref:phage portal protein n=1 Tax=Nocardioides alcanivorans TaxID=2897352 RepID=UPI001F26EC85|nr:phage portal protein [Nocardioides alcanivorans]